MSTGLYLFSLSIVPLTVLIVFGMKYASAAVQARARSDGDAQYRSLADRAIAVQEENRAALSAIQTEVTRLATSLARVEKVLQQVE